MSIIADALKKAESARRGSEAIAPGRGAETKMGGPARSGRHAAYAMLIAMAVILFIVSGSIAFLIIRDNARNGPADDDRRIGGIDSLRYKTASLLSAETPASEIPLSLPPILLAAESGELDLSGIMYAPDRPMAVVNNNIYSVGDSVRGFAIVEIGRDYVIFTDGETKHAVKLNR